MLGLTASPSPPRRGLRPRPQRGRRGERRGERRGGGGEEGWFVGEKLEPEIEKMHFQLIKVIDQTRMLDQDLIRLQQKVDVVLEMKENLRKNETKNNEIDS